MESGVWRLGAARIAQLVRNKELSAREVALDSLSRLSAVNGRINAVVDHDPERVLQAADDVDRRLASGQFAGLLPGVPVTVKAMVDQLGYATSCGARTRQHLMPTENSPLVDNLERAGAVIVGRTNTPAFAYRWFTSNALYGATLNPHDASLTAGGSSGGAAAAVATGIGAIAHGTDIAGSVRYPAYACGVHGIRPTVGRIPAHNSSLPQRGIGPQLMLASGPIARNIDDLSLALAAMSEGDPRDPVWVPAPLQGAPDIQKRVALCCRPEGLDTAPEIVGELKKAALALQDAGWQVDEVDSVPPLREAARLHVQLWVGDGYQSQWNAAVEEGDAGALNFLEYFRDVGRDLDLQGFSDALTRRMVLIRQWQLFLETYSVVLLPVSADLPFQAEQDMRGESEFWCLWEAQLTQLGLPFIGVPALALCTGKKGRVPLGVQIVAGRFREDLCLEAGRDIEQRVYRPETIDPDF